MKYNHSASAIIENGKGGKPSDMSINITVVTGGHQHVWELQGIFLVQRNKHPFRVERTIKNPDIPEFMRFLSREIGRQIEMEYERECGCNVDTGPIIAWINQEVEKFIVSLNSKD